jgi:hypothetical protein
MAIVALALPSSRLLAWFDQMLVSTIAVELRLLFTLFSLFVM